MLCCCLTFPGSVVQSWVQSLWSFTCSPLVCVGFLQVLQFPPTWWWVHINFFVKIYNDTFSITIRLAVIVIDVGKQKQCIDVSRIFWVGGYIYWPLCADLAETFHFLFICSDKNLLGNSFSIPRKLRLLTLSLTHQEDLVPKSIWVEVFMDPSWHVLIIMLAL